MNNINSIKISVHSIGNNIDLLISPMENILYINDIQKEISDSKIEELIRIILLWNSSYFSNSTIDSERYEIVITSDNSVDKLCGQGDYPDNYYLFKEWVGDILA